MNTSDPAKITNPEHALKFLLAGNAHVTFVSHKTGARFTYRVSAPNRKGDDKSGPVTHFVSVLTGPDNSSSYEYLGCIYEGQRAYMHGRKSRVLQDAPSAKAFAWVWTRLVSGRLPENVDVYHEGKCGKCGRRLTTPESCERGLGPECAKAS